jgi:hypothetical protein
MHIIPSALLRDAANASERYEKADAEMRRQWPRPSKESVAEFNAARDAAEAACRTVLSAGRCA